MTKHSFLMKTIKLSITSCKSIETDPETMPNIQNTLLLVHQASNRNQRQRFDRNLRVSKSSISELIAQRRDKTLRYPAVANTDKGQCAKAELRNSTTSDLCDTWRVRLAWHTACPFVRPIQSNAASVCLNVSEITKVSRLGNRSVPCMQRLSDRQPRSYQSTRYTCNANIFSRSCGVFSQTWAHNAAHKVKYHGLSAVCWSARRIHSPVGS